MIDTVHYSIIIHSCISLRYRSVVSLGPYGSYGKLPELRCNCKCTLHQSGSSQVKSTIGILASLAVKTEQGSAILLTGTSGTSTQGQHASPNDTHFVLPAIRLGPTL